MKVLLNQETVKQEKIKQKEAEEAANYKVVVAKEKEFEECLKKLEENNFENPEEREVCFQKLLKLSFECGDLVNDINTRLNDLYSNIDYKSWEEVTCSSCKATYPKKFKRCPCCHNKRKY